nr:MAG TPA: hypothetical protein [Caudoviricetes sp.]
MSNRNLSVAEYFIQIQREYLIDIFRSKIYINSKDKAYWKKVVEFKKEKIETISLRNSLKSILNDKCKYRKFYDELFDKNNKPKFELTETDLENYYFIGSEFSYMGEIFYLRKKNDDKVTIENIISGELVETSKNDIIRIV